MTARAMADALLLAAGEGESALADHGFVLLGKALDILRNARDGSGTMQSARRLRPHAEGDVFADGGAEEEGFLGNESDLAAQGFERILADGTAIDEDGSGRRRRRCAG